MTLEIVSATCSDCRRKTRCDLLYSKPVHHADENAMVDLWEKYNTLQCRGCETVFFQIDSVFSEDVDYVETPAGDYEQVAIHKYKYYPAPTERDQPKWSTDLFAADKALSDFYDELYLALNSNLVVLSTIAVRTVLERSAEILRIPGGLPAKLQGLFDKGFIGETEKQLLSIVKEAGNAAVHRAWRPKVEELNTIVDVLDQFLHRTFVLRHDLPPIGSSIPPRN